MMGTFAVFHGVGGIAVVSGAGINAIRVVVMVK
jgi:hypothetical protein